MGAVKPAISSLFTGLSGVTRAENWWQFKLPLPLAFAFVLFIRFGMPPTPGLLATLGILISGTSLAAFGHMINDLTDRDQDRLVGVSRWFDRFSFGQAALLLGSSVVAGFLPWLFVDFGELAAVVLFANYLLPLTYSAKPFRFKERGALGILWDAAGAHAVPVLFVSLGVLNVARGAVAEGLPLVLAAVPWSLLYGLRGIMLHQLHHRELDLRAGVITYVNQQPSGVVQLQLRSAVFPMEMTAFAVLLILISDFAFVPALLLLVFWLIELVKGEWLWNQPFDAAPDRLDRYIPPAHLYEVWFPLILVAALTMEHAQYLVLAMLYFFFFHKHIIARMRDVAKFLLLPA